MKKLILLFALVCILSCEKAEPEYCWMCLFDMTSLEQSGFSMSYNYKFCGMTPDEAVEFENANTYTDEAYDYSMRCKRKQ
jgi:hypothetical protein